MDNFHSISTYMKSHVPSRSAAGSPFRHIVAKWRGGLSLRARLPGLVGLGGAAVIAVLSCRQVCRVETTVEKQLVDSGRATALAVSDGMSSLDEADVPGWLHDFIAADPAVKAITPVEIDKGEPSIFASTSSEERSEAIEVARAATRAGAIRVVQTSALVTAAMPVRNVGRKLGVVVTVSMGAADQVRRQPRIIGRWFAAP